VVTIAGGGNKIEKKNKKKTKNQKIFTGIRKRRQI